MSKLMVTIHLNPSEADLMTVRRKLHLDQNEIDADFGVVSIRPADHLYAILVDESASTRLQDIKMTNGPFANPRIEPFGPPRR